MTYSLRDPRILGLMLTVAATALGGCSGDETPAGDFVSDNPAGGGGYGGDAGTEGESTGGGDDSGRDPNGEGGGDGERAISEADIIQVDGDRLYALSAYGGLTIIDVSTPDTFPILGHYRANAQPFEMYIDGGQVFVMYTDYGSYAYDEELGAYDWQTSSRLMALDATDPGDIQLRGEFDMPGWIQDSRRVGDVLYLVTYEDGWCWGCDDVPNTTITSLDVSDEANVRQVDQITFEDVDGQGEWSWGGARSVAATDQRLYVAGTSFFEGTETQHSSIDVIDISDPSGAMVRGANIEVAGVIQSRWQMDEYAGTLRVISQPGFWGSQEPPRIETFSIASSQAFSPLGSTSMTLPRPESLRSVRFDGDRAYAITFEQTDPLFTIDLGDPAAPRQVGELEIPGWVYHMEPRGDRVIGLGFDQGNPEGSLSLSLFDVSDFENPTMLSRVQFGGDWASFGEDQNRIHKAFQILDDQGLLLVPFSGWSYTDDESCGTYHSGIQLVDWSDDSFTRRGMAPAHGQARRALVHDGRLLGISDLAVEAFDISNRDAPTKTAETALASNVSGLSLDGDAVARLSIDWWTSSVVLETTTRDRASEAEPLGRLDLSTLVEQHPYECGYYGLYDAQVVTHEGYAYLVRREQDYETWNSGTTKIDVVDIRNLAAPTYVRSLELPVTWDPYGGDYGLGYGYSYGYGYGYGEGGSLLLVGDALVFQSRQSRYDDLGEQWLGQTARFDVIDLRTPGNPQIGPSLQRPEGLAHGGMTKVDDETIVSWHMRAANPDGSKVRFFLDRIDVSNPVDPQAATAVNVPGAVVGYDPQSQRALTVDFQLETVMLDENACWSRPQVYDYDYEQGRCRLAHRELSLVQIDGSGAHLLDSADLETGELALRGVTTAPGRIYVHLGGSYGGWGVTEDGVGGGGVATVSKDTVVVFADWESGRFDETSRVATGATSQWLGQLRPVGDKLLFNADNGLGVLDTTDPGAPVMTVHDLYGYGCWNLTVDGNQALCAMGQFGLQVVDL